MEDVRVVWQFGSINLGDESRNGLELVMSVFFSKPILYPFLLDASGTDESPPVTK